MDPVRLEQAAGMRQRLDDRAGIRQPIMEAAVPGHRTTHMQGGMQNPNRAKTGCHGPSRHHLLLGRAPGPG